MLISAVLRSIRGVILSAGRRGDSLQSPLISQNFGSLPFLFRSDTSANLDFVTADLDDEPVSGPMFESGNRSLHATPIWTAAELTVTRKMQNGQTKQLSGDYDLSKPVNSEYGLRQGLTSYGDAHFSLFLRKVFIKALGYSEDALSRPIIGIINTYSSFNPCHANVPQLIEAAKRGVQLAGGLAMEFPTISLHESFASPTSMFLRNLMSMDTEEMIRAQPLDACIMIGGA